MNLWNLIECIAYSSESFHRWVQRKEHHWSSNSDEEEWWSKHVLQGYSWTSSQHCQQCLAAPPAPHFSHSQDHPQGEPPDTLHRPPPRSHQCCQDLCLRLRRLLRRQPSADACDQIPGNLINHQQPLLSSASLQETGEFCNLIDILLENVKINIRTRTSII